MRRHEEYVELCEKVYKKGNEEGKGKVAGWNDEGHGVVTLLPGQQHSDRARRPMFLVFMVSMTERSCAQRMNIPATNSGSGLGIEKSMMEKCLAGLF